MQNFIPSFPRITPGWSARKGRDHILPSVNLVKSPWGGREGGVISSLFSLSFPSNAVGGLSDFRQEIDQACSLRGEDESHRWAMRDRSSIHKFTLASITLSYPISNLKLSEGNWRNVNKGRNKGGLNFVPWNLIWSFFFVNLTSGVEGLPKRIWIPWRFISRQRLQVEVKVSKFTRTGQDFWPVRLTQWV